MDNMRMTSGDCEIADFIENQLKSINCKDNSDYGTGFFHGKIQVLKGLMRVKGWLDEDNDNE